MDKTRGGGGGGVEGGDGKGVGGKLGLRGRGTRHPTWNIIPFATDKCSKAIA